VISNLVGNIMDVHLASLAAHSGCTYTRYADDLTFSTNRLEFPQSIAVSVQPNAWEPGEELVAAVTTSGFALNATKTRMLYRTSRQEVTGLVVNSKVNTSYHYRHKTRAMVHRLLSTGSYDLVPKKVDDTGTVTAEAVNGTPAQLRGMLNFIDEVDRHNSKLLVDSRREKEIIRRSRQDVFRDFILFSEFHAAPRPVLICEGETDNVYLTHAIRSLAAEFPTLAKVESTGEIKLSVKIFKYSKTNTGEILGIRGGTADLTKLIWQYHNNKARFMGPGLTNAVIMVIDNDSGANSIFNTVVSITGGSKPTGLESFVHVTGNIFAVPVPKKNQADKVAIEDCFDSQVTQFMVDGKTFHSGTDKNSSLHYGKVVFAHKVIATHASTINFAGFKPLLTNIVLAINANSKIHPSK
jgi:RNA-directed DNA polymerase